MDNELEAMRQQLNVLKDKLDKQEIVNDSFIRNSMKKNVSSINRRNYVIMAVGLFMIPYGYWAFVSLSGLSIAFWIATCVLMLASVGATFYNTRKIRDPHFMKNDLMEVRREMARAKKFDSNWLLIGLIMVLIWFAWFVYEIYLKLGREGMMPLVISGTIGAILGLIIGLKLHYKTQHQYQEIIDQIEDLNAN
ncbi:MAG: hypothetical protein J6S96_01900 [Muribaculaceae bacterium]|nr:hypothetical protein [Muribaculaceae bacterium]